MPNSYGCVHVTTPTKLYIGKTKTWAYDILESKRLSLLLQLLSILYTVAILLCYYCFLTTDKFRGIN